MPVWKQIEDGIRRLVAMGALRAGGPVPSVRELARDLRVNPMTVSKAYQRLSEAGLLEVRRGEGTYVSAGASRMTSAGKKSALQGAATRYAEVGITVGATAEEGVRAVSAAWQSLRAHGEGR